MDFELKSTHSTDGTKIAYYQIGVGPGIIIVHGGFQHAMSHSDLATSLAKHFTCYLPDRRGRGQSCLTRKKYSVRKEVEDVEAIHVATGAKFLFGVSSGAIITLKAALAAPPSHLNKIAVFEPPWWPESERQSILEWTGRFEAQVGHGHLAEAANTAMLGAQMGPDLFQSRYFPRIILVLLTKFMMRLDRHVAIPIKQVSDKSPKPHAPMFKDLVPTFRNDIEVAMDMLGEEKLQALSAVRTQTLVLGGSRSPAYLQNSVRELEKVLPDAKRVELKNVDHGGTFNKAQGGSPDVFAEQLKRFFLRDNGTDRSKGDLTPLANE